MYQHELTADITQYKNMSNNSSSIELSKSTSATRTFYSNKAEMTAARSESW